MISLVTRRARRQHILRASAFVRKIRSVNRISTIVNVLIFFLPPGEIQRQRRRWTAGHQGNQSTPSAEEQIQKHWWAPSNFRSGLFDRWLMTITSETKCVNCCVDNIAAASVMEQVAAVLDALADAKETTRQQVVGLVQRITLQLEQVEATNQQLMRENQLLREQLNMVSFDPQETLLTIRDPR